MNDPVLSRACLEGLTTQELVAIADRFDIDIPPDLDWNFIIEALLDVETELEEEKTSMIETTISGAVSLPEHYNITFNDILIRDPMWVFVFWEVKTQEKESYENSPDFSGYHLRILSADSRQEEAFTINVKATDTAWYVGIPVSNGCFRVELCVIDEEKEVVLAVSPAFTMPKLFEPQMIKNNTYRNPLLRLSGIDDFRVLHKMERSLRTRQRGAVLE
jgi:hypothetical protein